MADTETDASSLPAPTGASELGLEKFHALPETVQASSLPAAVAYTIAGDVNKPTNQILREFVADGGCPLPDGSKRSAQKSYRELNRAVADAIEGPGHKSTTDVLMDFVLRGGCPKPGAP
jgi:hypothetical protein